MILALFAALATPLGDAVMANDGKKVARLLADGADPNETVTLRSTSTSGFWVFKSTTHRSTETTPLHLALEKNRLSIAEQLLEAGADPDGTTRHRLPPLHHVAMRGRWLEPQVALLRTHGAQAEGAFRGRTALAAAKAGSEAAFLDALLAHGADLQVITCSATAEQLPLLQERGADPLEPCGTASLLHRAASTKDEALLEWLLAHGVDPDVPGVVEGREVRPLHLALAAKWEAGVQRLLHAGADPTARVGVTGPPPAAPTPDLRALLVRAGAPRSRTDSAELWALRPVETAEQRAFLEAWALDGLDPGPAWPLDASLRERFPPTLAEAGPLWGQLAARLTPALVEEALRLEPPLSCREAPLRFDALVEAWGPPTSTERQSGIKTWRWPQGEAVGRGKDVLVLRGACGEPSLVGRSRAFVWLALGPATGRTVERRGALRFVYRDGVLETIEVR